MNMPRVVCPTTEWILTNDPLRSYPKKGYQEPGFQRTSQTDSRHPDSCTNDRNHIAVLWMLGIEIHFR